MSAMIQLHNATTLSGGRVGHTCPPVAFHRQVISKVTDMKTCKLDYCDRKHGANGYCYTHDRQLKTIGRTQEIRKLENEFILHDDYAEIVLYASQGSAVKGTSKIDIDDVKLLKPYKWYFSSNYVKPYVAARIDGKFILLHRYLMGDPEEHIDHINGDASDNRRCNLRTATQSQNMMNREAVNGDMCGIEKVGNRWSARIKANKERYYLGLYETLPEAMAARQAGERILFGEYNRRKY